MTVRTLLLGIALSIGAGVIPLGARAAFVEVATAPPPPRYEVVPEARPGFIWVSGYWGWSGSEHIWVNGQYVPERLHHHWVSARWEHRGPHWYFDDGRWEADEDHNE